MRVFIMCFGCDYILLKKRLNVGVDGGSGEGKESGCK